MIDKRDEDRRHLEKLAKTGENSPVRKMRPAVAVVVGLLFLIVLVLSASMVIWVSVPDHSKEINPILKTTREQLEATLAIPADKNAWVQYEQAMNKMVLQEKTGNNGGSSVDRSEPDYRQLESLVKSGISPANLDNVKSLKSLNTKTLKLVDEGYGKEYFQLPVDEEIVGVYYPFKYSKLLALGNLLIVMGDLEVQQGNYQEAVRRYQQAQFLGRGIGENAIASRYSEGAKKEIDSLSHLLDLLNSYDGDKAFYEGVLREQDRLMKGHQTLNDALRVQLLLIECDFDNMKERGINPAYDSSWTGYPTHLLSFLPAETVIERERKVYENWYLTTVSSGKNREMSNELYPHASEVYGGSASGVMFPLNMCMLQRASDRFNALSGGVRTMIALQRYKLDKGQYPEDLKDLVPGYLAKLPEDPFSDKGTLRYKKMGDSILLYSLGVDRDDDNGADRAKIDEISGDMVFTDPPGKKK